MQANELRELAQKIEEKWWRWKDSPTIELKAANYLRACADALDAGPVAWRCEVRGLGTHGIAASEWRHYITTASRDAADRHLLTGGAGIEARSVPLYPLAMPAPKRELRLPEPLTDEEVDALIDETEGMETDRAVRYLVETGERRVMEVNE